MIEITASQGFVALVDECDIDLAALKWATQRNRRTQYAIRGIGPAKQRKTLYMHRVVMERILDRPLLKDEIVDHINHNGMDNRRENLRLASRSQNISNSPPGQHNTSGAKGVSWDKASRKWVVWVRSKGNRVCAGRFVSIEEAVEAYNRKAIEIWGEYAYLNTLGSNAEN